MTRFFNSTLALAFVLRIFLVGCSIKSPPPGISQSPNGRTSEKTIGYEQRTLPQSIVYILRVPVDSRFAVTPTISQKTNVVEEFARNQRALAVVNAGFFDPANQKSTSYVVKQGKLVADPRDNEHLTNNLSLKPYLSKIFNRSEFRRYRCGESIRYDITLHNELPPTGCQLVDAMGGGPQLLPELTAEQEGFLDKVKLRDPIQIGQPNARTAVGITRDRSSIILVMVAQKPNGTKTGMSLPELANFMKTLGVEKAMNLDGGSSSSLYYQGKSFYGKVDLKGNIIKRPVKSILIVREN